MENLETGQAWVCNAINEMPPLMCIVGRIDQATNEERIVSVRIKPHPEAEKIGWPIVDHVPIMASAFENSSLRLGTEKVAITDSFEEGYKYGKRPSMAAKRVPLA